MKLVEWELAGGIEVLGENVPQCHYVHHESHMASQTNIFPRKRLSYNNDERCFLHDTFQGVINGTSLEFSQLWDIRQPERTLAEDTVRICYQETTSEDVENFVCSAVTLIFRVCKPVRLLYLLIVPSGVYEWSINPVTNPNPVYGHTQTRVNIFSSVLLQPLAQFLFCSLEFPHPS
jgi:hypothetical protein